MNYERKYTVYMHRNRFDDKKYFGITFRPVDERWRNGLGYKKNSHFYNSILKYGWDEGFDHVILAVGLEEECAKDIERLLIAVFNTQNPKFGYNVTAGGDENPLDNPVVRAKYDEAMKKLYADPEYQKKQREAMKKVHADPEWQKNVRVAVKKTRADPEWQKNHSEALKKMHADPEWQKNQREVMKKVRADPEYQKNHREALKKMHADPEWQKNVREGAKKRSADPEWQKKHREAMKKLRKKVLCIETKIVYGSLKEAAIAVNLKNSTLISKCCRGKRKTTGGYHWEYA